MPRWFDPLLISLSASASSAQQRERPQQSGSTWRDGGSGIALDHGNAYVSCLFAGTASFGGITLTKPGESQFGIPLSARFVAKYGPDGALGADC